MRRVCLGLGLLIGAVGCGGGDLATAPTAPSSAVSVAVTTATSLGGIREPVLRALLDAWRPDVHAFGASVGVHVPGHGEVFAASGVDDREPDTPMADRGRFAIASVTKTFVTAIVLQLVEAGDIGLDETVERWVPDIPGADRITVRMLLQHTSGLPDYWRDRPEEFQALMLADLGRTFTPAEAIAYSRDLDVHGPPGAAYHYSNTNYQVLGEIAAAVTGEPIGELVTERLIEPLGLGDTSFGQFGAAEPDELHGWFSLDAAVGDPAEGTFNPALPRPLDSLEFPRAAVGSFVGASAAMRSSLADLLVWGDALYGGEVLGDLTELLDADPVATHDEPVERYGLGTMILCPCDDGEPSLVGHDGSIIGSRTLLVRSPATGVVVAIHANVQEVALADLFSLAEDVVALATTR